MHKNAFLLQEINNFSKIIREIIFLRLESVGQNQVSGLNPKKSGVIFFKPKLLLQKHSVQDYIKHEIGLKPKKHQFHRSLFFEF